jgi:hypothetical protein
VAPNWEAAYRDHTAFISLFDGKTLNGWDGEQGKWDVQDGTIHRHQTLVPKNFVDFGQYHIHYNEAGHETIAELLSAELAETVR